MDLTPEQLNQIKTAVAADPTANGYRLAQDVYSLRAWLNGDSGKLAWKSRLEGGEITRALIAGSAEVDNLSVGKRDTLFFMSQNGASVDTRLATVHQAFIDLTTGSPANATTVRAKLQEFSKRALRRWEDVFDTGPLSGGYVTTLEGELSDEIVNKLVV